MKGQTFEIGNTTIIIHENIPNEADIIKCYDVCNELFRGNEDCFYTKSETRDENIFLSHKKKKAIS